jgi:hypothetical protein
MFGRCAECGEVQHLPFLLTSIDNNPPDESSTGHGGGGGAHTNTQRESASGLLRNELKNELCDPTRTASHSKDPKPTSQKNRRDLSKNSTRPHRGSQRRYMRADHATQPPGQTASLPALHKRCMCSPAAQRLTHGHPSSAITAPATPQANRTTPAQAAPTAQSPDACREAHLDAELKLLFLKLTAIIQRISKVSQRMDASSS